MAGLSIALAAIPELNEAPVTRNGLELEVLGGHSRRVRSVRIHRRRSRRRVAVTS